MGEMKRQRPVLLTLVINNQGTCYRSPCLKSQERQARKLLRKKKKRLRELREEIRRMDNGGMKAGEETCPRCVAIEMCSCNERSEQL